MSLEKPNDVSRLCILITFFGKGYRWHLTAKCDPDCNFTKWAIIRCFYPHIKLHCYIIVSLYKHAMAMICRWCSGLKAQSKTVDYDKNIDVMIYAE